MRAFIYLAYDGTNYHGWQIQPNGMTVQQRLQEALTTLLRKDTEIVGAGRTDTGVHARLMVAHFDTESAIDLDALAHRLNRMLPYDIAIHRIVPVASDAHARFSATARTYEYHITTQKDPFARLRALHFPQPLDVEAMNAAAEILLTHEDFTSFSKLHTDVATNICHVSHARWQSDAEGKRLVFTITANRFLRNMVRATVGTLLEVGTHRISIDQFRSILNQKDRCAAGQSMPAHALYLTGIQYPETIFQTDL